MAFGTVGLFLVCVWTPKCWVEGVHQCLVLRQLPCGQLIQSMAAALLVQRVFPLWLDSSHLSSRRHRRPALACCVCSQGSFYCALPGLLTPAEYRAPTGGCWAANSSAGNSFRVHISPRGGRSCSPCSPGRGPGERQESVLPLAVCLLSPRLCTLPLQSELVNCPRTRGGRRHSDSRRATLYSVACYSTVS